jgi:hypothetical protein
MTDLRHGIPAKNKAARPLGSLRIDDALEKEKLLPQEELSHFYCYLVTTHE